MFDLTTLKINDNTTRFIRSIKYGLYRMYVQRFTNVFALSFPPASWEDLTTTCTAAPRAMHVLPRTVTVYFQLR